MLEGAWKASAAAERDLWQGLAQIAVGLTHLERGNGRGAATLLRRGAGRITAYVDAAPYDIDVSGVIAYADGLAAAVDSGDLPPATRTRLQLTFGAAPGREGP